ncbi:MAG TPA: hypothetical protein DGB32_10520, partial [Dehalococcoidia bacterium]|nr:hypothetical protein [Dehalococcoidia bacterium]
MCHQLGLDGAIKVHGRIPVLEKPLIAGETHLEPQYEILSDAFSRLIDPDARLRKLGEGYLWAEGTTWVPDVSEEGGGYLLWSDIPNDRMLRWSESDGTTTFRQPCGYTNGHTLDREGRLVSAEHGGRR